MPLYNEAKSIDELYERLSKTMGRVGLSYEFIFVDDGSTDKTLELLKDILGKDDKVVIVELRRNFGKSSAYAAGFDFSRGRVIITMDGDLQHQPEDIPKFIEKIEDGYDVVCSRREKRVDRLMTRRIPSWLANRLVSKISGVEIRDFGGGFKAYKREVIEDLGIYSEMHRFLPALVAHRGARIAEVPIKSIPRPYGKSKYGLERVFEVIFDLITLRFLLGYLTRPMYFFGKLSFSCIITAVLISLYVLYDKFVYNVPIHIAHEPLAALAITLLLIGVIFVTTGLIGEMLCRIYFQSTNKKIYSVHKVHHRLNSKKA